MVNIAQASNSIQFLEAWFDCLLNQIFAKQAQMCSAVTKNAFAIAQTSAIKQLELWLD